MSWLQKILGRCPETNFASCWKDKDIPGCDTVSSEQEARLNREADMIVEFEGFAKVQEKQRGRQGGQAPPMNRPSGYDNSKERRERATLSDETVDV